MKINRMFQNYIMFFSLFIIICTSNRIVFGGELNSDFYEITNTDDFSEGLASIEFTDGYQDYAGWINTNGELQYYYPAEYGTSMPHTFESGMTMIEKSDSVYIVNDKGQVINAYYDVPDDMRETEFGDGYSCVAVGSTDFYGTVYKYEFRDPFGNVLYSYEKKMQGNQCFSMEEMAYLMLWSTLIFIIQKCTFWTLKQI